MIDLRRYAFGATVVVAMLAGCGGTQPPIGVPGGMPQTLAIATHAIAASRGCCRKQRAKI